MSATHEPTGTKYEAVTGPEGRFQMPSVRVGPYTLVATLSGFREKTAAAAGLYHGPLVLRLRIDPAGSVADCAALLDRVLHPDPGHADWERVCERLLDHFRSIKFSPAAGETMVAQPIAFGTLPAGAS